MGKKTTSRKKRVSYFVLFTILQLFLATAFFSIISSNVFATNSDCNNYNYWGTPICSGDKKNCLDNAKVCIGGMSVGSYCHSDSDCGIPGGKCGPSSPKYIGQCDANSYCTSGVNYAKCVVASVCADCGDYTGQTCQCGPTCGNAGKVGVSCSSGACTDTACGTQTSACACQSYCKNAGQNVAAGGSCGGVTACSSTTCADGQGACVCGSSCIKSGATDGNCGGVDCTKSCANPACAGKIGPGGKICCQTATVKTDCATYAQGILIDAGCTSCAADNTCKQTTSTTQVCNDLLKCGTQTVYGGGTNADKLYPSKGYCTLLGQCTATNPSAPKCDYYDANTPQHENSCVEGREGCASSMCSTIPYCKPDNIACQDQSPKGTTLKCHYSEGDSSDTWANNHARCTDKFDNDGDGLIDESDPDCNRDGLPCTPSSNTCPTYTHTSEAKLSYCVDTNGDQVPDTCSPCTATSQGSCGPIAYDYKTSTYGICTGNQKSTFTYTDSFAQCSDGKITTSSSTSQFKCNSKYSPSGTEFQIGSTLRTADNLWFEKCGDTKICTGSSGYPSGGECDDIKVSLNSVALKDARDTTSQNAQKVSIAGKLKLSYTVKNTGDIPWKYDILLSKFAVQKPSQPIILISVPIYTTLNLGPTNLLSKSDSETLTKEIDLKSPSGTCDSTLIGEVIWPGEGEIRTGYKSDDSTVGFSLFSFKQTAYVLPQHKVTVVECEIDSDCDACGKKGYVCNVTNNECVQRKEGETCGENPIDCNNACMVGTERKPSQNLIFNSGFEITSVESINTAVTPGTGKTSGYKYN